MNWTRQEITKSYNEVAKDSNVLIQTLLDKKHLKFKETFPKLYQMAIINSEENKIIFNMMMDQREKQINGKIEKNANDMFVGNQLGKKFIYPLVGNPTQKEMNEAVKKINSKLTN